MAKKKRKMSFRGKVKADNKNHSKSGNKYSVLDLPEGLEVYKPSAPNKDVFDILPYIVSADNHPDKGTDGEGTPFADKGSIWYKRPYKVHKDVGADNLTVVCLESFGKKCPICEYKKAQQAKGVEWEELKIYKPKDRVLYAIKPVAIKKHENDFYILDMSFYLFQNKLNEETNEEEDYEDFPMLEGGYSLKVRWVEGSLSKKGREYCEAGRIDFVDRDEDYDEDILDEVPDLDSLLIETSYDKMKALFFEDPVDEDESDEEEETPFKDGEDEVEENQKAKKTSKKKAKKEPEPEPEHEYEGKDLLEMDADDLVELCEAYGLDSEEITEDAEDEDEAEKMLREAIADELGIEMPKKKKKPVAAKKTIKKSTKKGKCPVKGGEFGVTTDEYDECDECPLLDACITKNEED